MRLTLLWFIYFTIVFKTIIQEIHVLTIILFIVSVYVLSFKKYVLPFTVIPAQGTADPTINRSFVMIDSTNSSTPPSPIDETGGTGSIKYSTSGKRNPVDLGRKNVHARIKSPQGWNEKPKNYAESRFTPIPYECFSHRPRTSGIGPLPANLNEREVDEIICDNCSSVV